LDFPFFFHSFIFSLFLLFVGYLGRDNEFFGWTVFMTGTDIVPPDDFSLADGDFVEIEIEKIGVLRNPVSKLR
jgi:2-dehydro-3-deoxy-D-arabinonate dehydratase